MVFILQMINLLKLIILATLLSPSLLWSQTIKEKEISTFLSEILGAKKSSIRALPSKITYSTETSLWGHVSRKDSVISISESLKASEKEAELNSTLLHEKIHLLYYSLRPEENDFVLEGIALLSEFLFLNQHYGKLKAFRSMLPLVKAASLSDSFTNDESSYGHSFLFHLFLYVNFGESDFLKAHLQTKKSGLEGLQKALQTKGIPKNWAQMEFIQEEFQKSLLTKSNTLGLKANDLFEQLINLR